MERYFGTIPPAGLSEWVFSNYAGDAPQHQLDTEEQYVSHDEVAFPLRLVGWPGRPHRATEFTYPAGLVPWEAAGIPNGNLLVVELSVGT